MSSRRRHEQAPRRAPRTQEERRAETRTRLLDATVECLAELGWSGTSTTEVARRAGVSRGAQQHHYPTKMLLVGAALEHLLERQRLAFERAFAALPAERRNVEGALDLLWETFRQAPALALMELAMAARTDVTLRELSIDINERIIAVILEVFHRLFPESVDEDTAATLIRAVFAMFVGLTLQHSLDDDAHGHQAAVLGRIKALARLLIPDPA
ncbi:TetR/AcrR family transcriptional regulator [Actinoallomurus spadix]|uniref:TetR/AcrR family transcriptional regulator n=1 Tax=Actinoallomurus spadix TaxID=79912 RepID=A0ABP3FC38_9ACTN|nr:TetR/AcrR family transcriptional regulator [Actinoallomurus spadix]MCO5991182.1 TetR/AcrR family transcriptional regulator [Actinoallomurus spadix]